MVNNTAFSGGTEMIILNAGVLAAQGGSGSNLGGDGVAPILNGGTLDFNSVAGASTKARNNANPTTVAGNTTIISECTAAAAGQTYTLGALKIGANTLTVSGGDVTSGTAGLNFVPAPSAAQPPSTSPTRRLAAPRC